MKGLIKPFEGFERVLQMAPAGFKEHLSLLQACPTPW